MSTAPNMSQELLSKLSVGDILLVGALFPGLSEEPISWIVLSVSSKGVVTFQLSWFGVHLGRKACKVTNGKVIWTEAGHV